MSKFKIGDEVILSVDPYKVCPNEDLPYAIGHDTWREIKDKPVIISSMRGVKEYRGYTSNNALFFGLDKNFSDFHSCIFPEEWFEFYRKTLFNNEEDFLL